MGNKKEKEEILKEKEPAKKEKKEYTGDLRGFKSLEIAKNYPNTPEFAKLDIGCRTEYQNWLKSILEEE